MVALEICEHHLKVKGEGAKVVFMATKVDVYEQQYKLFQQHFQHKNPDIRSDTHTQLHTHTVTHTHTHTSTDTNAFILS